MYRHGNMKIPPISAWRYSAWRCINFSFLEMKVLGGSVYPTPLQISISLSGWLCNLLDWCNLHDNLNTRISLANCEQEKLKSM